KGTQLPFGPVITHNDRNRIQLKAVRGFQTKMAIDHLPVAGDQDRHLEAELSDRFAHAVHHVVVTARIPMVGHQLIRPTVDGLEWRLRSRTHRPSRSRFFHASIIFWAVSVSTNEPTTAPIRSRIRIN